MANLVVQRQPWYKALFNTAQVSLVVFAACSVYEFLGGSHGITLDQATLFRLAGPWGAAALAYYLFNMMLVCGVLALTTASAFWITWRENWGYRVEIVSAAALFLLSPIAAHAYQGMGVFGLAAFLLPMWFIRDACERFIALERTQQALIGSEQLAAKGEMGAQIGNMATRSKGLMNFSQLESQVRSTNLCELVKTTVEFLRPQKRFDNITFDLEYDPPLGSITLDPAQIQQILMNLLNNAADAITEARSPKRRIAIKTRWRSSKELLELVVSDSGPGVPAEFRSQIFEPSFTTKENGHGFGLSTVFRIVENHKGTIALEDAPSGGALFRICIPARFKPHRLMSAA